MQYCKCDIEAHNHPRKKCDKPAITHDGYCEYCVADIALQGQAKVLETPPKG